MCDTVANQQEFGAVELGVAEVTLTIGDTGAYEVDHLDLVVEAEVIAGSHRVQVEVVVAL